MSNKFFIVIDDLSSLDHSVMKVEAESSIEVIYPLSTAKPTKILVKDLAVDQEET
jgi:hypothetical protein|tara:strand:+ start:955 stop:1119 length:165 start_codon:yes stop_codon:yes gene_type:complete